MMLDLFSDRRLPPADYTLGARVDEIGFRRVLFQARGHESQYGLTIAEARQVHRRLEANGEYDKARELDHWIGQASRLVVS